VSSRNDVLAVCAILIANKRLTPVAFSTNEHGLAMEAGRCRRARGDRLNWIGASEF